MTNIGEELLKEVVEQTHPDFDLLQEILEANKDRNYENLPRRILKLGEEFGELSEAYLSVTSNNNSKNKNWRDVMEEAVDCAILSLDIVLTIPPPLLETAAPMDKIHMLRVINMFEQKLAKWRKQLDNQNDVIQDVESKLNREL